MASFNRSTPLSATLSLSRTTMLPVAYEFETKNIIANDLEQLFDYDMIV